MIKAIFFDLDGTLLPLDESYFTKAYFKLLYEKAAPLGYEQNSFINAIMSGTKAMYLNAGSCTNEETFWKTYETIFGKEKLKDKVVFDEFYKKEFYNLKQACGTNSYAKDIIEYCKTKVKTLVLSTNPIFPYDAQAARLSFINLKPNDFTYITSYENSSFCKPNPMYFKMLLDKFNLKPDEVILFGNNTYEDADCANSIGIKCFLIKDCLILDKHSTNTYDIIEINDIKNIVDQYTK